ncbi:bacteriocin [Labilibaculum sp. K2S]|nr:bacteriocin [Labilibaculum sp. K2S]MDM8160341.1 bacteriocin [Labilibaculum sp. K2S]MDM8160342.1 bacteriocin [Labilibaculum sp. K2S]
MKNFEIVSQEELQNIKGGINEMTDVSTCEDCIV